MRICIHTLFHEYQIFLKKMKAKVAHNVNSQTISVVSTIFCKGKDPKWRDNYPSLKMQQCYNLLSTAIAIKTLQLSSMHTLGITVSSLDSTIRILQAHLLLPMAQQLENSCCIDSLFISTPWLCFFVWWCHQ